MSDSARYDEYSSTPPSNERRRGRNRDGSRRRGRDENGRNAPPNKVRRRRRRDMDYESDEDDEGSLIQFERRESASESELFYDLWFVANLTVFATVHPISHLDTLVSFVGYFLLLWNTWFITTVYDARFVRDGILARTARACHLTVMIGFAIAGSAYDRENLIRPIIKALSLFLTLSRLVLAAQYGLVLYNARNNQRGRVALSTAVIIHLIPAIAYLIVGVVSNDKQDRHLIIVWYVMGLLELLSVILHAMFSKTLSFEGTHFNERLNLLTLIVLGEGVIILTKNASKIVTYTYLKAISTHWSAALIGTLFSAGAILYITFQLYFDWLGHHQHHMAPWRHAFWTLLHLPFHAVLVLLSAGSSQWAVWWRAIESYREVEAKLEDVINDGIADPTSANSSAIAEKLKKTAYSIMKKYGENMEDGSKNAQDLDKAFDNIGDLPSRFWNGGMRNVSDPNYRTWVDSYLGVSRATINSVSTAFGLVSEEDDKESKKSTNWQSAELAAVNATSASLQTIFVYLFLSAGIVLMILMALHILSKSRGWTRFDIFRVTTVFLTGIVLTLLATIRTSPTLLAEFVSRPWQLPIILILYFFVLILTHLPYSSKHHVVLRREPNEKDTGHSRERPASARPAPPSDGETSRRRSQRNGASRRSSANGVSRRTSANDFAYDTDRPERRRRRQESPRKSRRVGQSFYDLFVPWQDRESDRRRGSRNPPYWV